MIDERTLHPADETLLHQAPWPFLYTATSDHRFFDRYWFAGVEPSGKFGFVSGLAMYKNMGVCDGFLCILEGDRQHNARFSRALGDDVVTTGVGGLTVDVVEPFRQIRVRLADSDTPLTADLTFTSAHEPACEAHYVDSRGGRVGQEITRYHQPGRWTGSIQHPGETVTVDNWWGTRDHSWGVRPGVGGFDRSVADPHAAKSASPTSPASSMLHIALVVEHDDFWVSLQQREDGEGRITFSDVVAMTRDGVRLPVGIAAFDVDFHPGTRQYDEVTLRLVVGDGKELLVSARPLIHAWAYAGTGYDGGYRDGRGLGTWRGAVAEYDVYVHADREQVLLDGQPTPTGHREQLARMTVNGVESTGYCAVMTRGTLPRRGLYA
ncbi:hypothetical protein ACWEK5_31985 [Rhodococcus koreensis]